MFNLKLGNQLFFLLGVSSKPIEFALLLTDCLKQLRVCLLPSQEFVHDFLNVSYSSLRPNSLESIFNEERLLHFLVHLHLVVLAPHLLNHEILSKLDFVLVLVLICSCFCNFGLPLNTIHTLLQSIFLVFNAGLK
jgi:hypothetical protein